MKIKIQQPPYHAKCMNGEYNCNFMIREDHIEWCSKNARCHNQDRDSEWKLITVSKPKKTIQKEIVKTWDDSDITLTNYI